MTLAVVGLDQSAEDPIVSEVWLLVRDQEDDLAHALPPADARPAGDDLHQGVKTFRYKLSSIWFTKDITGTHLTLGHQCSR